MSHPRLVPLLAALLVAPAWGAIPIARRLLNVRLERDLAEVPGAPPLAALTEGGEEVPLGLVLEAGGEVLDVARWGDDRFELVRGRSPDGDESLLALDHRARRYTRLAATRYQHGGLAARRSPDGGLLLVRSHLAAAPGFAAFLLGPKGVERLARFVVPWGELDRDMLRRLREGGVPVTSPDTQLVAFTHLDPLKVGPDGPLLRLRGTAYLGRLDAWREALRNADPTLDLSARDIFLTRDWVPPGTLPVALRVEKGRAWVEGVGNLDEQVWSAPAPSDGTWVLPRPRP